MDLSEYLKPLKRVQMKTLNHQETSHEPGLMRQTVSSYINLMKPHVTILLLGTTIAAMAIAQRGWPGLGLVLRLDRVVRVDLDLDPLAEPVALALVLG